MNASTKERFTQPRDAIVVVGLRAAGGPGSGNFGHAGRPGKVGGSAPDGDGEESQDTTPKQPARSKAAEAFHSHFKAKGYKVAHVDEVPDIIQERLALSEAQDNLPPEAMNGIELALEDIEKMSPLLHEAVLNTTIVYAHQESDDVSATFGQYKGETYFFINANQSAVEQTSDPTDKTFTVGSKAFNGDPEQVFRAVLLHEAGHLADSLVDDNLTGALVATLLQRMPMNDVPSFLRRKISTYAMVGGPKEAAAEVFAATVLGLPLPEELHGYRDELKLLLARTKRTDD